MEEVIQILVFVVIVLSVIISKYKEVNANRPGQHAQKAARAGETDGDFRDAHEATSGEDFADALDDTNVFREDVEELNETEEEFRKVFNLDEPEGFDKYHSPLKCKPVVFDRPAPWKEFVEMQEVAPQQLEPVKQPELQRQRMASKPLHQETVSCADETLHEVQPQVVSSMTKPGKKTRVRLKTREEARQAFIYAEIFNRRYE